jgi:RNA polymerase sigma-70 factor (ECF subfamily)
MEELNMISFQNTEEDVILREHIQQLKQSLSELPENQRKVIILKHYYNYSYEEIAKIINCPLGTVRSKLHYGILKLKRVMKKLNGGV